MKNPRQINIAHYREQDWDRFVRMVDDPDTLHETWEEWKLAEIELKLSLESDGFLVREVMVNLDELDNFCKAQKVKNNGQSRSRFIQLK